MISINKNLWNYKRNQWDINMESFVTARKPMSYHWYNNNAIGAAYNGNQIVRLKRMNVFPFNSIRNGRNQKHSMEIQNEFMTLYGKQRITGIEWNINWKEAKENKLNGNPSR